MKPWIKCYVALLLILTAAPQLAGQTRRTPTPDAAGLSRERLDRIGKLVQSYVDKNQIAGAVTLVARRGRVVHSGAFGTADTKAKTPMRSDTIFRIASMTKPVTSVAAMMLYEEGRVLLTDPVSKYIPEFKDAQVLVPATPDDPADSGYKLVPASRPITIRHLLTHTSGISYRFFGREHLAELYKKAAISDGLTQTEGTIGDMCKKLAKLPLLNQPGEAWEYGLSTDVLGRVVEVASGMSLDQFLRERIFKPLGMKDTHFFLPPEKLPRLAAVYRPTNQGGIERIGEQPVETGYLVFSTSYSYQGPRTYFSGGAGLASTAHDYWRFLQMLANGGHLDGVRLLGRKTVELMTGNHIGGMGTFPGNEGYGFGYGFGVHTNPGLSGKEGSAGEYTWGGFFYTYFWVDPKEQLIGLMMTQIFPNNQLDLGDRFRVLVYGAVVD